MPACLPAPRLLQLVPCLVPHWHPGVCGTGYVGGTVLCVYVGGTVLCVHACGCLGGTVVYCVYVGGTILYCIYVGGTVLYCVCMWMVLWCTACVWCTVCVVVAVCGAARIE